MIYTQKSEDNFWVCALSVPHEFQACEAGIFIHWTRAQAFFLFLSVDQVGFKTAMLLKMALNSRSSYLTNAEITGMCHHARHAEERSRKSTLTDSVRLLLGGRYVQSMVSLSVTSEDDLKVHFNLIFSPTYPRTWASALISRERAGGTPSGGKPKHLQCICFVG